VDGEGREEDLVHTGRAPSAKPVAHGGKVGLPPLAERGDEADAGDQTSRIARARQADAVGDGHHGVAERVGREG
jgi:hypothetical protein